MKFLLIFIIFGFSISTCFAQTELRDTLNKSSLPSTGITPSMLAIPQEGELNVVKFTGNTYFSNSVLQDLISSLPSDLSFAHRIFRFYYRQLSLNPYTPKPLEDALGVAVKNYEDEYRYFDQTGAENDVLTLIDVYNQYGFHDATASYSLDFDTTDKVNVLTFSIQENHQYSIDTILYTGLDSLPIEFLSDLQSLLPSLKGTYFNEPSIKNITDAITNYLQNKGYYFSHYDQPVVYSSPVTYTDSIIVPFSLGKRCKIGSISVKSDFKDQNPISDYLIRQMLDFHEGDWYSRASIGHSQSNLYGLATFDLVSIDTLELIPNKDFTVIPLQIFLQYRKQKEIVVAPFYTHTTENYSYLGGEASVLHRNLFGGAQSTSLFFRGQLQDFKLPWNYTSSEIQYGGQFSQPILWQPFDSKMGFSVQLSKSNRSISSGILSQTINLQLSTIPIRFSFPFTLPSYTFINSLFLDLSFEWLNLSNFQDVAENIQLGLDPTSPTYPNDLVLSNDFIQYYANLNIYAEKQWAYLGPILTITPVGDTRNNPFSPTNGHFFSFSLDIARFGIYLNFSRFLLNYSNFISVSSRNVIAFKAKIGHIYVPNNFADNPYIPPEKGFFAGGANSIRSYDSRKLTDPYSGSFGNDQAPIAGCASIIEGSFEFRYRFNRPRGINSTLADQIEQLGVTFFMDIGNVYNQLQASKYGSARLHDFIYGLAVGIGAGIRRETPVGPIRIDFATQLYDPTVPTNQLIFSRQPFSAQNLKIHIGLGHAF